MRGAAVAVAVMALATLGAGAASGPAPQDAAVHIQNFAYNPSTVDVLLGESVAWDNLDAFLHTVTADDGSFDSGSLVVNDVFTHAFTVAGEILYHCSFHASMHGTVRVSDPRALPDLVVTGISLPGDLPDTIPGVQQRVDVDVRNLGLNQAPATHVALGYRYHATLHDIGTQPIDALSPGASQRATFVWDTTLKVGDFTLVATADSEAETFEANEANNNSTAVATVLVSGQEGIDLTEPL